MSKVKKNMNRLNNTIFSPADPKMQRGQQEQEKQMIFITQASDIVIESDCRHRVGQLTNFTPKTRVSSPGKIF
jgi:hypothetical protein